jgi:hypothetical protein
MAGPGDELTPSARRGHMRASHADREHAIGMLKTAFVQGMLTKHELDLRIGEALASRTYADLAAVIADLPVGLEAARPLRPAAIVKTGQPLLRPRQIVVGATVVYAALWALFILLTPITSDFPGILLILFGGPLYLCVLGIALAAAVESRQRQRADGQLPGGHEPGAGGPAGRRLPPVGQPGQLPPVDPRTWRVEASQRRRSRRLAPNLG